MAVTTGTYTVSTSGGAYTPAAFAAQVRLALIDCGHMTEWHASFLSGTVENRVLKLDFDNTKTYGSTFIWFMFSGADMFYHICRGWNTSSNIPQGVGGAGSQYVDFLSTTTNATTNHMRFAAQNASTNVNIKRYTSQNRANFSVLLIKNGSVEYQIIIDRTAPSANYVDLNKECWDGCLLWARTRTGSGVAVVNFQMYPAKLRGSNRGRWLRGVTVATQYGANPTAAAPWEVATGDAQALQGLAYGWTGNTVNDGGNATFSGIAIGVMLMQQGFTNVNPAFTSDYNVSFYDIPISLYTGAKLPSDFAIYYALNNITLETFTTITVGSDNGEVIAYANGSVINERGSAVFFAVI